MLKKSQKNPHQSARKINVLYISNHEKMAGGSERCLCDLLNNLDRSRFTPYFASIYDGEMATYIRNLGIRFLKLNEFRRGNPLPYIYSQYLLTRFIRKNNIKIIHNNQCRDTFYSWLPAKLANAKIIIHHRDSRKLNKVDKFFMNHVDTNICISTWQNANLLSLKATLVHDGIDLRKISSNMVDRNAKPSGSYQNPITVGLVGRIQDNKGQHLFLDAAKIVKETDEKVKFVIIGDTNSGYYKEYYQSLLNQIEDLKLREYVSFEGFIDDLAGIYSKLDISVVTSSREAFGMVVIEAMAFSKPVITTNSGGPADIVTDETGILVPVNDPESLANAILLLMHHPETRKTMGQAGNKRVKQFFTIEKTLGKIYDVYDELLK